MNQLKVGDIVVHKWDHSMHGRVMAFNARGHVFVRWMNGRKEATIESSDNLISYVEARAMDEAEERRW